jgi:hypothetical protein
MKEKTFTDRQVLLRQLGYRGGGSCSEGRSDPGKFDLILNILTVFVLEMRRAEPTFGCGLCCFLDKDPQYDCNRQTNISIYVPRQRLGTVSCKVMWDDSYGTYPSV